MNIFISTLNGNIFLGTTENMLFLYNDVYMEIFDLTLKTI